MRTLRVRLDKKIPFDFTMKGIYRKVRIKIIRKLYLFYLKLIVLNVKCRHYLLIFTVSLITSGGSLQPHRRLVDAEIAETATQQPLLGRDILCCRQTHHF